MLDQRKDVIVGVDGSENAKRALHWAVAKAALGPVTPLLVYAIQPLGDGLGMPTLYGDIERIIKDDARNRLQDTIEGFPELTERTKIVAGQAGPTLVRASAGAGLLVVGSRGRSAVAETLFGSVGSYCVKHATVPVAVITGNADVEPTIKRAVVGIDGSPNSAKALEWALRHVDPSGQVIAVGCWTDHVFDEPPVPNPELERSTADIVEETVSTVTSSVGHDGATGPLVESQVQRGDPRIVLRDLASTADLLVLGARGHRGVSHLLVGSTTTSLLHHPKSPTVVVPLPD